MRITEFIDIDATAATTWQIFGEDFADISNWLDAILSSSLDGDLAVGVTRTCKFAKNDITEQITRFDRDARSLTYKINSGLPPFMRNVSNAWTIEELANGRSRATSAVAADLAWYILPLYPLLKVGLRKTLRGALSQLSKAAQASGR